MLDLQATTARKRRHDGEVQFRRHYFLNEDWAVGLGDVNLHIGVFTDNTLDGRAGLSVARVMVGMSPTKTSTEIPMKARIASFLYSMLRKISP